MIKETFVFLLKPLVPFDTCLLSQPGYQLDHQVYLPDRLLYPVDCHYSFFVGLPFNTCFNRKTNVSLIINFDPIKGQNTTKSQSCVKIVKLPIKNY
jgi:hypothetical protein